MSKDAFVLDGSDRHWPDRSLRKPCANADDSAKSVPSRWKMRESRAVHGHGGNPA
jgi:hypothetical protein